MAEIADRGHEVWVHIGVRVGSRPGGDDIGDHADRLVEEDRSVLRERDARPQQVDVLRCLVGLVKDGRGDPREDVLERRP